MAAMSGNSALWKQNVTTAPPDVYTSLAPVQQVCRFFGFAPFVPADQSQPRSLRVSSRSRAYSSLLIALIVAAYVVTVVDIALTYRVKPPSTQSLVNNFQQSLSIVLVLVLIASSNVNAPAVSAFLRRLSEVDERLASIDAVVPHARHGRVANLQLGVGALLFAVNLLLMARTLATSDISEPLAVGCYWLLYQIATWFTLVFTLWFVDGVLLLRERFRVVNGVVDAMCGRAGGYRPCLGARARQRPLDAVRLLVSAHASLTDLADAVNAAHAPQLLLLVAASFVNLTTEINYFVFSVVSGKMAAEEAVHSAYMIALVMLQVVLLAVACGATSDKGNETADLVHELLPFATSARLKDELELFSMQLVHRKVQFTAWGFFPLDSTLIFSIVAGVTTYMVILIQVQTAPK